MPANRPKVRSARRCDRAFGRCGRPGLISTLGSMIPHPQSAVILADPSTGVHYSPLFYALCVVAVIAVLIVFFAVVRFALKTIDRRSRG
jgi:hypothetical protein